jgi:hypothetical protein
MPPFIRVLFLFLRVLRVMHWGMHTRLKETVSGAFRRKPQGEGGAFAGGAAQGEVAA